MAIGERIRFFRNLRGMTQKYLGQVVGFPEKTADIRMAQYESGSRTPKAELTSEFLMLFPSNKREALLGVLAQDPRPAYQNDPERVYGVNFAGRNVQFKVDGDRLTVCSVDGCTI